MRKLNCILFKINELIMRKIRFFLSIVAILYTSFVFSASVDSIFIKSKSMNKEIGALVIKPENYSTTNKEYPVIYILHGFSDTYGMFFQKVPKLTFFADVMNVIIVCPDGGYSSWYVNSPTDKTYQYETHISSELITEIDTRFRTIKSPKGRAITGLSMGGHGALLMATNHPDVFGAAGSMSGGVDLTFKPKSWQIASRLGNYETNKEVWFKNSVFHQIQKLQGKNVALIIDCGKDDFFYEINKKLHNKMLELKIPHDFIIRPGEHSWEYWKSSIEFQMLFFYKFFYPQTENK